MKKNKWTWKETLSLVVLGFFAVVIYVNYDDIYYDIQRENLEEELGFNINRKNAVIAGQICADLESTIKESFPNPKSLSVGDQYKLGHLLMEVLGKYHRDIIALHFDSKVTIGEEFGRKLSDWCHIKSPYLRKLIDSQ